MVTLLAEAWQCIGHVCATAHWPTIAKHWLCNSPCTCAGRSRAAHTGWGSRASSQGKRWCDLETKRSDLQGCMTAL